MTGAIRASGSIVFADGAAREVIDDAERRLEMVEADGVDGWFGGPALVVGQHGSPTSSGHGLNRRLQNPPGNETVVD